MNGIIPLLAGETICWEGRPAPRCYIFRHWRHALFGFIILAICGYWQVLGFEVAESYNSMWLAFLPLPFLLFGCYLSVGHLFQARLEWNHVRYMITDRRLLVQRGLLKRRVESLELRDITYFSLSHQGEHLGTLRVHKGLEQQLILHCVEYPRQATALLEVAMAAKDTGVSSGAPE
jgi:hypothetical protein